MPEHGCYAVALGPDRRQVRSVNSNDGHLLAAGMVPARLAHTVAERMFRPDTFSGWRIGTLSAEHPAYNPFSYHRGSVWPVEAGTTAIGLARYGCWRQLHQLAEATFAAAALFEGHRLPEALVQALLGLRPVAPLRTVVLDPHLPDWLPDLHLEGIQVGNARFDLTARRHRTGRVSIRTRGDRITVVRQPPVDARLAAVTRTVR